jgi:PAS domain S-box-containing protein
LVYYYFYQTTMILGVVLSLITIALMWPRRNFYGAKAMIAMLLGIFFWTFGFLLEGGSQTLERQLFFNNIGYLGSMTVPVAWLVFALNYSSNRRIIFGWRILLVSIIPAAITVLIWTNGWHHLMWSNEHLGKSDNFLITIKTYGPFFWVALVNNYVLIFSGGIVLLRRLFVGKRLYRGQATALIVGVLLPWIWNIIYVFHLTSLPRKDLTPVTFAVSCAILMFGLVRFQLFIITPFAHQFVINHLNDGIFTLNTRNRLVDANPAALRMFQLDESIIGKKLEEVMPLSSALEHLSPSNFGRLGSPLTLPGGQRICELETAPMSDEEGTQVGWLAIFHDITERKRSEAQLEEAYRKETEMRRELEMEMKRRAEFTRALVHELKTPLTPILASSDGLVELLDTEPAKSLAANINRGGYNLNKRIDELLDVARSELNIINVIPVRGDIRPVIEEVAAEMSIVAEKKNQKIILEVPRVLPEVNADYDRIKQVMQNLVINAVKYTQNGGQITISARESEGQLVVEVRDNGAGLSGEEMDKLFEPYYHKDKVGQQLSGLGLGLSLCKKFIDLHGGKIWAESTPGKGSVFSFSLPVIPRK